MTVKAPPPNPEDDKLYPPSLPPLIVLGLSAISVGVFLWVWALMWGHWIKKMNPASHAGTLAYANIVPGALLFINLPSLLLARRENDGAEMARLHISIVLWGIIAAVSLIATWTTIYLAQRKIKAANPQVQ